MQQRTCTEAAERAVVVVRARRMVERRRAGRHLEVVRDAVDRAQRHQRHAAQPRVGEQRPRRLQRDRQYREPGAEPSRAHAAHMMT